MTAPKNHNAVSPESLADLRITRVTAENKGSDMDYGTEKNCGKSPWFLEKSRSIHVTDIIL